MDQAGATRRGSSAEETGWLRRLHHDDEAAPTVEYMLILVCLIPFAFTTPAAIIMIRTYFYRCAEVMALPFP